jgi:hypothetical protein
MSAIVQMVSMHASLFSKGFPVWIEKNEHIWKGFEVQANRIHATGRKHYSAYTIVEWMRHNTALAEVDGRFKISNNIKPDLARLYALMYPERGEMFSFKQASTPRAVVTTQTTPPGVVVDRSYAMRYTP